MILFNFIASIILIIIGIYALVTKKTVIKAILGIGIIAFGLKLLVVTAGFNAGGTAPVFNSLEIKTDSFFVDPLAQVIAYVITIFSLVYSGMALAIHYRCKKNSISDNEVERRD